MTSTRLTSVTVDLTVPDLTENDREAIRDAMGPEALIGHRHDVDGNIAISTRLDATDVWHAINETMELLLGVLRDRGRGALAMSVSAQPVS